MPPTVISDIYGTTQKYGYATAQGESVTRRHFVEGLSGADQHDQAVAAVASGAVSFATAFPDLATLGMQRQSITTKQIGVGKFIVEEQYAWNTGGSWGNFPTTNLCEYKLGYEGTQVYTVGAVQPNGLPGRINQGAFFKDSGGVNTLAFQPQPYIYQKPVLRIGKAFKSTVNPLTTSWFQVLGKVNNSAVSMAGFNYPTGTLRFDGLECSVLSGGSYIFQGTFTFTAAPSFEEQVLYKTLTGTWEVDHLAKYATAAFPALP